MVNLYRLWFDEELGSKTTGWFPEFVIKALWFDEELGSKTTVWPFRSRWMMLWFDEELGSKTTLFCAYHRNGGCGLMKNWDLRQLVPFAMSNTGVVV